MRNDKREVLFKDRIPLAMTYVLETPQSGSGDVPSYTAGSTLVFGENVTCASYSGPRPGNETGENVRTGCLNIPFQVSFPLC